jgi:hypothetical protein
MNQSLIIEVIQDGYFFDVEAKEKKINNYIENERLSLEKFHSLAEVEHYIKNVPLNENEVFENIILITSDTNYQPRIWTELIDVLVEKGRMKQTF